PRGLATPPRRARLEGFGWSPGRLPACGLRGDVAPLAPGDPGHVRTPILLESLRPELVRGPRGRPGDHPGPLAGPGGRCAGAPGGGAAGLAQASGSGGAPGAADPSPGPPPGWPGRLARGPPSPGLLRPGVPRPLRPFRGDLR